MVLDCRIAEGYPRSEGARVGLRNELIKMNPTKLSATTLSAPQFTSQHIDGSKNQVTRSIHYSN